MFESLYIVLGIGAIWYILYWSIRNDKARSIEEQTGWLRMKSEDPERDSQATNNKGKWKPRRTIEKEKETERRDHP